MKIRPALTAALLIWPIQGWTQDGGVLPQKKENHEGQEELAAENVRLRGLLEQKEKELAGLNAEMKNMREEVATLQRRSEQALAKLTAQISELEKRLTESVAMQAQLEKEVEMARRAAQEHAKREAAELEARQKSETEAATKIAALSEELAVLRRENAGGAQRLAEETESLRQQLRASEAKLAQSIAPDQLEAAVKEKQELIAALTDYKQREVKLSTALTQLKELVEKVRRETIVRLEPVYFATTNELLYKEQARLALEAKRILQKFPSATFNVTGYSGKEVDDAADLRSSAKRAQIIGDYLKENGIPPQQVIVVAGGSNRPIASNATQQGRKRNRRVEVEVALF